MTECKKENSGLGKEELLRDTTYERSEITKLLQAADERELKIILQFVKHLLR